MKQNADVTMVGYHTRKLLAEDHYTPSEILTLLAMDSNMYVRGAVARNPSTPSEALDKLADDVSAWNWVQSGVDTNPSAAPSTLERLAKRRPANVVRNPAAPTSVLDEYATSEIPQLRRYVAENPGTSPATLNILLDDEDSEVREAARKNPNSVENILLRVSTDSPTPLSFMLTTPPSSRRSWVTRKAVSNREALRSVRVLTLLKDGPDVFQHIQGSQLERSGKNLQRTKAGFLLSSLQIRDKRAA